MPPPKMRNGCAMEYPNRKYPRLKQYDYQLPGYYYITIHNERNTPALSVVMGYPVHGVKVSMTTEGCIAQEQLELLEKRYPYARVDKFVIMPTHIHMILRLLEGCLPRAGVPEIIGAYKSLTTREINQRMNTPGMRRFQRSFYDRVLRTEKAYQECWLYIDGNPEKWAMQPEDF